MNLTIKHKNKKFKLNAKVCNFFQRFSGLMFCRRESARAFLFDFKKPVRISLHSFFVFFPFIVIWLDDKNKIIKIRRIKPFTLIIYQENFFNKAVEIPINGRYFKIIKLLDGETS